MAISWASSLKSGVRATKSVSQAISTRDPIRPPEWMYGSTMPCAATRPAFLSALAKPCCRSRSIALSMLPSVSWRARLHSIMPAPVFSRSVFTWSAVIATILTTSLVYGVRRKGGERPIVSDAPGLFCVFCCSGGCHHFRFRCRDDFGSRCRGNFRNEIALGNHWRLDDFIRSLHVQLAIGTRCFSAHSALDCGIGNACGDQTDRANRIVVGGDDEIDRIGIAVGVSDGDDRN